MTWQLAAPVPDHSSTWHQEPKLTVRRVPLSEIACIRMRSKTGIAGCTDRIVELIESVRKIIVPRIIPLNISRLEL